MGGEGKGVKEERKDDLTMSGREGVRLEDERMKRAEPVFLNVYGVQESILRNEFRQPM